MSIFSCLKQKTQEEIFWMWFEKKSNQIFYFENNQDQVFNSLAKKLQKINPDLTFEIGPIKNNKREFIISAGGIKSAFINVEKLYSKKPNLMNWEVIKFRPRRKEILTLKIDDKEIKPSELRYLFFKDDGSNKIGLLLLINNFNSNEHNLYAHFSFLYLDQIIGEYDVETYLGGIEIQGFDSKYYDQTKEISFMADEFDSLKNND